MTDGDNLPILVPSELRERESIWYFQGVLVLRGHGQAAYDGKRPRNNRNRQHPLAAHRIPPFLLVRRGQRMAYRMLTQAYAAPPSVHHPNKKPCADCAARIKAR